MQHIRRRRRAARTASVAAGTRLGVAKRLALGLPEEARDYSPVRAIVDHLSLRSIVLLTNNPFKVDSLRALGVDVVSRHALCSDAIPEPCERYLHAKEHRMGHLLFAPATRSDPMLLCHPADDSADEPARPHASQPEHSARLSTSQYASSGPAPTIAQAAAWSALGDSGAMTLALLRDIASHERAGGTRPFVTLTYAQALDGSIAGPQGAAGERLILSGRHSMSLTHALRASHQAILVGVGTVLSDDPQLTVRLVAGRSPRRVVLDGRLETPLDAKVLRRDPSSASLAAVIITLSTTLADGGGAARADALRARGATVVGVDDDGAGRVCWRGALGALGRLGISSVMVEGGASVIGSCLAAAVAHRVIVTVAPRVLINGLRPSVGGGRSGPVEQARDSSSSMRRVRTFSLGDDVVVWSDGPAARDDGATGVAASSAEMRGPAHQVRLSSRL